MKSRRVGGDKDETGVPPRDLERQTAPDDRGLKKNLRGGGGEPGLLEQILAVSAGALIYLIFIRPYVLAHMTSAVTNAIPAGATFAIGIPPKTGIGPMYVSCEQDFWCRGSPDISASCFEIVPAENTNERFLRYNCPGHDSNEHHWVSYKHLKDSGIFRVGLWRNKQNAIPFKFVPSLEGAWHLQSKYPASGYDKWFSFDAVSKDMVLVSEFSRASQFGLIKRGNESLANFLKKKSAETAPQAPKVPPVETPKVPPSINTYSRDDQPTADDLAKKFSYLGCYTDSYDRDLKGKPADVGKSEYGGRHQGYDVSTCGNACRGRNFKFFALQAFSSVDKSYCFCGDSYGGSGHVKVSDFECGSKTQCILGPCGKGMRNAVYAVN